ncbi:hypothetical protein [Nigerium massiliense]|uniref:hypothetical protein n=1 Tax=Nigerium massiliense TaxID=1522317 RepID=UPI0005900A02|nr:hypothetical protein [Nigerium massiliense]
MGDVRFYALGIDELRDLFSGSPAAAERMRALAARAFAPPEPVGAQRQSLLSRMGGPLTRRPPKSAPVVRPDVPTATDLGNLLAGHHVTPDRLEATWTLVRLWAEDAAWGSYTQPIDEAGIDEIDFQLSSGGVETRHALRRLFNNRLALPIGACPRQVAGYVRGAQALEMRDVYREAASWLDPERGAFVRDLAGWLDGFEEWTRRAPAENRPAPDLIAAFTW